MKTLDAPDLQIARSDHANARLGDNLYVFGGIGNHGFLSSIEFLDISESQRGLYKKAWIGIKIEDVRPRKCSLFYPVDSSKFLIYGGEGVRKYLNEPAVIFDKQKRQVWSVDDQKAIGEFTTC